MTREQTISKILKMKTWHSRLASFHHDNPDCHTSANIKTDLLFEGEGGRPLCPLCKKLKDDLEVTLGLCNKLNIK